MREAGWWAGRGAGASHGATERWAWRGKRASDALGQAAEAADCWASREGGRARDCGGRRRHAGPVWLRHRAGQAHGAEVSEGALGVGWSAC